jgi:hypothetical protein
VTSGRQADTDQFYHLLAELAHREQGPRRLGDCAGTGPWPRHGVYFFYEDGEDRADGSPRVVRVGTHALTATSRATMWARLRQHRGRLGGRNPGGGNHRASIFRSHVGTALIRSGDWPDGLLQAWAGSPRRPEWADMEDQIERQVSHHIRAMPFLWLAVPNHLNGTSDRGYVEKNSIALLSCRTGGTDQPSPGWLGHHASSAKVCQSGLWNSNHVDDTYDPDYLPVLADLVTQLQ